MKTSVRWLNAYLDPATVTPDEAERVLMDVGFPIESRETLPDGDTRLDVELTSNRGDCLSHLGLAREIAARTGRTLRPPTATLPAGTGPVSEALRLDNTRPDVCPIFTARVVRGVKVGPSPAWLATAVEAVGQRSINNVVDATNYVNFELGQPTHAFDLHKLAGRALVIRFAHEGERLTTLDGKARVLKSDELVVADADRAQSLAGVIGGQDAEVTASTTDLVLEAATWDPVTIRRAARRLQIRTDAGHRFERIVDPRTVAAAADRLASIILDVAGGALCAGMLSAGRPAEPLRVITLRPERVRQILGIEVPADTITRILTSLSVQVQPGSALRCTIPAFRPDLTREIDLIEEVARVHGLAHLPVLDALPVRPRPAQRREAAERVAARTLTALGFYETVTFSFCRPADAEAFAPTGSTLIHVDDERRGAEPTLRPSVLPSLLACRRANQDAQNHPPGGVRLFESASVFAQAATGAERRVVALLADVPGEGAKRSTAEKQIGVRLLRGALESLARTLGGQGACLEFRPASDIPGFDPDAAARVVLHRAAGDAPAASRDIGAFGLIAASALARFGVDTPQAAAEVELEPLLDLYPPRARVSALPAFPSIERDLSLIVPETTAWARVGAVLGGASVHLLEGFDHVATYRGKPLAPGTKSVTLRLRFRDPARTLRHEEVDPQMTRVVELFTKELGATLRA